MERISKFATPCLHVHLPAQRLGDQWLMQLELLSSFVDGFNSSSVSKIVRMVDLGGGWSWEQFKSQNFQKRLYSAFDRMRRSGVDSFLLEPGKSLAQAKCSYVSRVLDVRKVFEKIEVVVDGTVTALGDYGSHPRSFVFFRRLNGNDIHVFNGNSVAPGIVMGRTCMEDDVFLGCSAIPLQLRVDDYFMISDCGAYDSSMGYAFGTGGVQGW